MTIPRDHDWLLLNGGAKTRLGSGLSIEREAEMLRAVVEFVNQNGLARQTIPVRDDWEGFELRRSQLTEEGYAFLSKQLTKWLTGIDRGKAPSDTSSMSRALAKFQSAR